MRRTSLDLMSAWSAIEIALWDIVAKNAGQPLYNILGGASRERVKVYANGWSSGTDSIEQNVERALTVKEAGYTALKWDPFPGPWRSFIHREDEDHVVRYVRQMREALGPDFTLAGRGPPPPRAHACHPHRPSHRRIRHRLVRGTLPVRQHRTGRRGPPSAADADRYRGGDLLEGRASPQALAARAADIINPDICNCGGISAMLDIAAMAQPHAVAIAPHNYNSTLVGLAATVQLSAMIPNFWIAECFVNLKPACDEIAVTPLTVQDSFVDLPTTPGIGIDLDVARLRAKPYRDMGTRMGKGLRSYTEEFPRKHYAVAATRTGY